MLGAPHCEFPPERRKKRSVPTKPSCHLLFFTRRLVSARSAPGLGVLCAVALSGKHGVLDQRAFTHWTNNPSDPPAGGPGLPFLWNTIWLAFPAVNSMPVCFCFISLCGICCCHRPLGKLSNCPTGKNKYLPAFFQVPDSLASRTFFPHLPLAFPARPGKTIAAIVLAVPLVPSQSWNCRLCLIGPLPSVGFS